MDVHAIRFTLAEFERLQAIKRATERPVLLCIAWRCSAPATVRNTWCDRHNPLDSR